MGDRRLHGEPVPLACVVCGSAPVWVVAYIPPLGDGPPAEFGACDGRHLAAAVHAGIKFGVEDSVRVRKATLYEILQVERVSDGAIA